MLIVKIKMPDSISEPQPFQQPVPIDPRERMLSQIEESAINPEEREIIRERFAGLVDTISLWAQESEREVEEVRPLGGGFKNPVVLVRTASGESFVAKGFKEEESLETTKSAQVVLDTIVKEDEPKLIPSSEIYNNTLFSKEAKGAPVKKLITESMINPELTERAIEAFEAVGATLGIIHERTERPIDSTDDMTQQIATDVLVDREKALRHVDELAVGSLLGLSPEQIQQLKDRIVELTQPEYVALIHGDAHLDQFFHEVGGSTVEIVDYDDVREGDPMADLGRLISSQRYWCEQYEAPKDLEFALTRAIVRGYETTRRESGLSASFEELDVMKVVAYELRLYLVKLKAFTELRQKLQPIGHELSLSESEILRADDDTQAVVTQRLSAQDRQSYAALRHISSELDLILTYLRPPANESNTLQEAA